MRDSFDAEGCAVKKALKSFHKTVGYDFTIEIAWVDLWNDLESKFPDKAIFVPTIADAIVTFLQRLENLLESCEGFGEVFLNKMEGLRKAIFIQVSPKYVNLNNTGHLTLLIRRFTMLRIQRQLS